MTTLREKWRKAARAKAQRAGAECAIARARSAGRTGPAVLVTNLAQMGDVVLSAGVCAALRARFPQAPLVFAGQPRWLEILQDDPAVDGLLAAETLYEVRSLARTGLFPQIFVLDIPIPDLLHYLDGLPQIYRYAPPTTADWFQQGKNLMAFYEQNAGLEEGEACPRVWVRPEDREHADKLFADAGLTGPEPIFALHTHSSMASKNWPLEYWAALITRWQMSHGVRFVTLGGPGEALPLASLPGVTDFSGKLTLKQTAAVIAKSNFFIGLDSGVAYIAEAMGTPGLILLGATVEETSGPRDRTRFRFVRAPHACLPACHRACTRSPLCVTALDVDIVDQSLQAAWSSRQMEIQSCVSP
jgi:heptosyltransferase-3